MTSLKDKFIPGAKVGAYELVRRLGAGGMGTVFEARGPSGRVAVKVLTAYPVESGRDPRFQREAEALRLLSHPGIVPVLDAGTDRERLRLAIVNYEFHLVTPGLAGSFRQAEVAFELVPVEWRP